MGSRYDCAKSIDLVQKIQVTNRPQSWFAEFSKRDSCSKYFKISWRKSFKIHFIQPPFHLDVKKPFLMIYASIDLATFRNAVIPPKDVKNVEIIPKNGAVNAGKACITSASTISTGFKTLLNTYLLWTNPISLRNVTASSF